MLFKYYILKNLKCKEKTALFNRLYLTLKLIKFII